MNCVVVKCFPLLQQRCALIAFVDKHAMTCTTLTADLQSCIAARKPGRNWCVGDCLAEEPTVVQLCSESVHNQSTLNSHLDLSFHRCSDPLPHSAFCLLPAHPPCLCWCRLGSCTPTYQPFLSSAAPGAAAWLTAPACKSWQSWM